MDIDPVGGRWIYSASEAHNEEQQFELWRLGNWLNRFNLTPVGLTDTASPYHASGHISGPELRELISTIRPKQVIPLHSAEPSRFVELLRGLVDVRMPEVGVPITL